MIEINKKETFIEHDIVINGITIGEVELCPERKEISRLVLYKPYQDMGYGTKVVKELISQGYTSLWVRSDNEKAIHVYEKCGFKKCGLTMYEMKYSDFNLDYKDGIEFEWGGEGD